MPELDIHEADPVDYRLYQNYPNPFNFSTSIAFDLMKAGTARLTLYDMSGREVFGLPFGILPAGRYPVTVELGILTSGLYIYEVECNGFSARKTMVILK